MHPSAAKSEAIRRRRKRQRKRQEAQRRRKGLGGRKKNEGARFDLTLGPDMQELTMSHTLFTHTGRMSQASS